MSIAPLGISWFIMQGRTEAISIYAVCHLISNYFYTLEALSTCPFSNSNKFNYVNFTCKRKAGTNIGYPQLFTTHPTNPVRWQ
jgi:hypothetical protein